MIMCINGEYICMDCLEEKLEIENLHKALKGIQKELDLYRKHYSRPIVVKEIIHHPARLRDSQCLYGKSAYDEIIYE